PGRAAPPREDPRRRLRDGVPARARGAAPLLALRPKSAGRERPRFDYPLHARGARRSGRRRAGPLPMPDEAREFALLCPRCGEENPPEFPVCWSCHAALPADRRPKKEQAAVQELEEPPDPLRRKRIALELGVAILVIWVPGLVGGIWRAVEPQPPQGTAATLWGLLHVAGILALLA